MEEKKTVKVSLGTIICLIIIVILVIALGGMYYYYNFIKKDNSTNANTNSINTIANESDSSYKTTVDDGEMNALI